MRNSTDSYFLFLETLKNCFLNPLPGISAHLALAPELRKIELLNLKKQNNASRGSVLILFYEKNGEPYIVFQRRPSYKGVHSGQISFPGGKWESTDKSLYHTALRETREEIGIGSEDISLVGKLSNLYIPPSNFLVHPYVAWKNGLGDFFPDPKEVEELLEIPFSFFLQQNIVKIIDIRLHEGNIVKAGAFVFEKHIIWGATAMILNELLTLWTGKNEVKKN